MRRVKSDAQPTDPHGGKGSSLADATTMSENEWTRAIDARSLRPREVIGEAILVLQQGAPEPRAGRGTYPSPISVQVCLKEVSNWPHAE